MISTNFYGRSALESTSTSTMEDDDENNLKHVSVSLIEVNAKQDSIAENTKTLDEYPRVTQRRYVINKVEQHQEIWGDLLGSKGKISFQKENREETIQSLLFLL